MGIDKNKGISEAFEKKLLEGILVKSNATTLLFNSTQPLGTIKRHVVVVPKNAEKGGVDNTMDPEQLDHPCGFVLSEAVGPLYEGIIVIPL